MNSEDSNFIIWVGVEVTDHPAAIDGKNHTLHASVFVADQIVTSKNMVLPNGFLIVFF